MAVPIEYEIIETESGEFSIAQAIAEPNGSGAKRRVTLHREYPTRAEAQAEIDRLTAAAQ